MKTWIAALALVLLAGTASADSTWTYTGNVIDYKLGINPGPIAVNPCGCALDGFVTLDANGVVTSYSFSAGKDTLTQNNSAGLLGKTDLFAVFNPADNYFRWSFDIVGNGVEMFSNFDGSYSGSMDYVGTPDGNASLFVYADPGTWANPVSTPEPDTIALVGLGLAALALKRRKNHVDSSVWEPLA